MEKNCIVIKNDQLFFADMSFRCALGRSGIKTNKQEGDGATPAGTFPLREVFYRADKIEKPKTALPVFAINPNDGWCDDPKDKNYNSLVELPYSASYENLWREDNLYDLFVVIGYNDDPVKLYAGSAIFLHIARDNYLPTEGCVALAQEDLTQLINKLTRSSIICIEQS